MSVNTDEATLQQGIDLLETELLEVLAKVPMRTGLYTLFDLTATLSQRYIEADPGADATVLRWVKDLVEATSHVAPRGDSTPDLPVSPRRGRAMTQPEIAVAIDKLDPFVRGLMEVIDQHHQLLGLPLIIAGLTDTLARAMEALLTFDPARRAAMLEHVNVLRLVVDAPAATRPQ